MSKAYAEDVFRVYLNIESTLDSKYGQEKKKVWSRAPWNSRAAFYQLIYK